MSRSVDRAIASFAGGDPVLIEALRARLRSVVLNGGDTLFRQGEPGDAMYLIASGVIGVSVHAGTDMERRVARLLAPEPVGEMALLTAEPRSATVTALRDTRLLRLAKHDFDELLPKHPAVAAHLARVLAARLGRAGAGASLSGAPKSLAVVGITPGVNARALASALADHMAGRVEVIEGWPEGETMSWSHRRESGADRVIYAADAPDLWGSYCLRHADHVLLVARPNQPALPIAGDVLPGEFSWRKLDLLTLHRDAGQRARCAEAPAGARLALRLHLREGHAADLARIARTVSGTARALVLSGGGARGFAHLGVLKALGEAGADFDLVAGTSFGGIVAAGLAAGWNHDELCDHLIRAFVDEAPLRDYTLPLVALTRGRKVEAGLFRHFGDVRIEELWKPFFCVSSNLTSGSIHVHREGRLVSALRASVAIPGLIPPVVHPEGVLVDGAIMNNLPVDVMSALERGPVTAVDVANDAALVGATGVRGGMARIGRSLLGIDPSHPDIAQLLLRTATVASRAHSVQARAQAAAVIRPVLTGIDLRGWRQYRDAMDIGYRHARTLIETQALVP